MFRLRAELDETEAVIPAAANGSGQPRSRISKSIFEITTGKPKTWNVQELADINPYG